MWARSSKESSSSSSSGGGISFSHDRERGSGGTFEQEASTSRGPHVIISIPEASRSPLESGGGVSGLYGRSRSKRRGGGDRLTAEKREASRSLESSRSSGDWDADSADDVRNSVESPSPPIYSPLLTPPHQSPNLMPSPSRSPLSRPGWPLFLPKVARVHNKSPLVQEGSSPRSTGGCFSPSRLSSVEPAERLPAMPEPPGGATASAAAAADAPASSAAAVAAAGKKANGGGGGSSKAKAKRAQLLQQQQQQQLGGGGGVPEAVKLKQIIDNATLELDLGKAKFADVFAKTLAEASAVIAETPKRVEFQGGGGSFRLPGIPERSEDLESVTTQQSAELARSGQMRPQLVVPAPAYLVYLAAAAGALSLLLLVASIVLKVLVATDVMPAVPFRLDSIYMAAVLVLAGAQALLSVRRRFRTAARNALLVCGLLDLLLLASDATTILSGRHEHKYVTHVRVPLGVLSLLNLILVIALLYFIEIRLVLEVAARKYVSTPLEETISRLSITLQSQQSDGERP